MLFLLSPAKTLDYDSPTPAGLLLTRPQFLDDSAALIALLRSQGVDDIRALMDLSEPLAQLNVERYQAWRPRFTDRNSKPAVLAFNGDVYDGLDARTLSADDLAWAQVHVRMLSGLYGLLRPLDRMQPYRLEMGTRLANPAGPHLYAFWGDRLARHLSRQADVVINLASQEYFRAADRPALKARVVHCDFQDWKNGEFKTISFFAKRARGLMARHAIQQRVATPEGLHGFAADGYRLDDGASSPDHLVFRRRA